MAEIGRKYSLFDPKKSRTSYATSSDENCIDCSEDYCSFSHCMVFDADGDAIEPVVIPASGPTPEIKFYKKVGTVDTMAKQPFTAKMPCCYKVTISGVMNNSADESWCRDCEQLNKTFRTYVDSSFFTVDDFQGEAWTLYDLRLRNIFSLCNVDDYATFEDNSLYPKSIFAPCQMFGVGFGSFLRESGGVIQIIGQAAILAQRDVNTIWWTHTPFTPNIRIVALWEKVLGEYTGDLVEGYTWPTPKGVIRYGNLGNYDCTNQTFEFSSSDLVPDKGGTYPLLDGLCDFSAASLIFEPVEPNNFDYKNPVSAIYNDRCDSYNAMITYEGTDYTNLINIICKGKTALDQYGRPPYWWGDGWFYTFPEEPFSYLSDTLVLYINNLVSVDENVEDKDLTIHSCKDCLNNTTIRLRYNRSRDISDYNYNILDKINTCCQCGLRPPYNPVSTCIQDILVYFYVPDESLHPAVGYPTFLPLWIYIDFVYYTNTDTIVIARFKSFLGDVTPVDYVFNLGLDCSNLLFTDFVYDADASIGALSEDWQRCDFSQASLAIAFDSYENLGISCNNNEPIACVSCSDRFKIYNLSVDIPNAWTWNHGADCYDYYLGHFDLSAFVGSQPISGEYVFTQDSCLWEYKENLNLFGGEFTGNSGMCCPNGDLTINLRLTVDYDLVLEVMKVKLVFDYLLYAGMGINCLFGPSSYLRLYNTITYQALVTPAAGTNIKNKNTSNDLWQCYYGKYMDCSLLDGLELSYVGSNPSLVLPVWSWNSALAPTITIREI